MFFIDQLQLNALNSAAANQNATSPYADMYDLLFAMVQGPNANGSATADGNTIAFLGAAAQVNRGEGGASDLIRDYTSTQILIRSGTQADISSQLQSASDTIAQLILDEIEANVQVVNGENVYRVPSALEIGASDLAGSLSQLNVLGFTDGAWSGNLLYLGLGEDDFYSEEIIENTNDTYDLFALRESAVNAGLSENIISGGGAGDLAGLFALQGVWSSAQALATGVSAFGATDVFVDAAYGNFINDVLGGTAQFLGADFWTASTGSDTSFTPIGSPFDTDNDNLHGGAGADTLLGSLGLDLIDGGTSTDIASFAAITFQGAEVTLDQYNSARPYSAVVEYFGNGQTQGEGTSILFDIEELVLGNGGDRLIVNSKTHLDKVSAGVNGDVDDVVNVSGISGLGVTASLDQDFLTINSSAETLVIENFEDVLGSAGADSLFGNMRSNDFAGGEMADIIDGGDDIDFVFFRSDSGAVTVNLADGTGEGGEAEGDIYTSIEGVVGTDGNDEFISSASGGFEYFAGGEGMDTFTATLGPTTTVVWGGEGKDTIEAIDGSGVLLVTLSDLTLDNFSSFRVEDLGLGSDFDWNAINLVVINPDSEDELVSIIDGEPIGNPGSDFIIETLEYEDVNGETTEYFASTSLSSGFGTYNASFLGGGVDEVYARGFFEQFELFEISAEFSFPATEADIEAAFAEALNDEFGFLANAGDVAQQANLIAANVDNFAQIGTFQTNVYSLNYFTTTGGLASFLPPVSVNIGTNPGLFVAGGSFDGFELVSDGSISAALDPNDSGFYSLLNEDDGGNGGVTNGLNVVGTLAGESLTGSENDDTISPDGGDDTVIALGGNDTVIYTSGNDTVVGGSQNQGSDTLDLSLYASSDVTFSISGPDVEISTPTGTITLTEQIAQDIGASTSNIESIVFSDTTLNELAIRNRAINDAATAGNDTITGTAFDDTILASAGKDSIFDGAGDDVVNGGDGDDSFFAGAGADAYDGGAGTKDKLFYSASPTGLVIDLANPGNNTGLAQGDTVVGIEWVYASDFDDTLVASADTDRIFGEAGNDTLVDAAGAQFLSGGAGADTFELVAGDGAQDRITDFEIGTDQIDLTAWGATSLTDLTITERLTGQGAPTGDLIIAYGSETLRLDNLAPSEIANFTASDFVFAPFTGDGVVSGTSGNDTIDGVYADSDGDVINDTGQLIQAGLGNDTVFDGAGDDTVEGQEGDDAFFAGAGADAYNGGAGTKDKLYYSLSLTGLVIDLASPQNNTGIALGDTVSGVEWVYASDFDDTLIASADTDRIFAQAGDDTLIDAAGSQFMSGGTGADTFQLVAADGAQDRITDFELDVDVIDLSAWGATALSDLTITERLTGQGAPTGDLIVAYGSESLRLDGLDASQIMSFGADDFVFAPYTGDGVVTGTSGNDTIDGLFADADGDVINDTGQLIQAGLGNDTIFDGAGNDTVEGQDGDDSFFAGAGADAYDGGAGTKDKLYYSESATGLTIDLENPGNNTGIAQGDTVTDVEWVYASDQNDTLVATGGIARIFGLDGDDTLRDGAGSQFLGGGSGADTFEFIAGDGAQDRVTDFELGIDLIDLTAWGAMQFTDLTITERLTGQGAPTGDLIMAFGAESIRVDGYSAADIASFDDGDFLFV